MSTRQFIGIAAAVLMLAGCRSNGTLLPNVSGKAGEIIVAMDRNEWDGNLGSATRDLLAAEYPFLPLASDILFRRTVHDVRSRQAQHNP